MAFLYIDRIKRDFQRTDHCLSRRVTYRKWSPEIVIERLNSQTATFDDRCLTEAFPVKSSFMNLVPKVPKIFTIGLKLDRTDDDDKNAGQFWNVASVKNFFKQYFSFIRRCQSYLHISWKYTPNENDFQYLSFSSSASTISRCRRCCCRHKSHCVMLRRKHAQPLPREREASQCGGQFSTRNSSKLESRGSQCQFIENAKGRTDPPGDIRFVVDQSNKTQSVRAEAKFAEYSCTSRVAAPRDDQVVKSKKDACCQTTFTSVKSCHGSSRKNHVERKSRQENNCVSTNASSSRDVETIFATTNFEGERSKTNPESLEARTSRKRRIKRTDKRSRKHDAENSSRKESSGSRCASAKRSVFNRREAARERKLVERKGRETTEDQIHSSTETFYSAANFADGDSTRIPPRRRGDAVKTFVENYDIRCILNDTSGEIHAISRGKVETSMENVSRQSYWVEGKTSESAILGNVKKRLEEDYDDYFSVDNDLFLDAEDPSDVLAKVDGPRSTDRYTSLQKNDDQPTSVTTHQRTRQELTKRSLPCTSSVCFTDLSCSRSSYHTSMREQEYSPSTKIVDNVSPSFGEIDDSLNNFLQIYSMDTGLSRGNNSRASRLDSCPSNDLANSYTVCCYQRNSTPNFSNSSKFIAESLDSGILTDDCSRDQLRAASNEDAFPPGEGSEEMVEQGWKRQARTNDLLLACDLNTDSSYSDESLSRRVDVVVKKFTDKLILSERRARTKLRCMGSSPGHGQARKRRKGQVRPCTIAGSMIVPVTTKYYRRNLTRDGV
ncbi:hypothetical protein QLX08_000438 [Tetragonisca angustula]|uniref:Uncharacterized protein n=1 Tax=Tetragonisca angustula TaxID=166442 RepID=A0AAW1AJ69_9HYME